MEIHRARQAVEKKDEQLNASKRILEAQEDELLVSVVHKINIPCSPCTTWTVIWTNPVICDSLLTSFREDIK